MARASKTDPIFHPVRLRILQAFTERSGRTRLTAQQLGELLPDLPPATLYRHLKRLSDGRILRVIEQRPVRGATERVYGLEPGTTSLTAEELASASREDQMRYFATFAAGLLGEFAHYLQRPEIDLARDGVGYRQAAVYLSDAEFRAFLAKLVELIQPLLDHEPAPGRKRRLLTGVVLPLDGPVEERSGPNEISPAPGD